MFFFLLLIYVYISMKKFLFSMNVNVIHFLYIYGKYNFSQCINGRNFDPIPTYHSAMKVQMLFIYIYIYLCTSVVINLVHGNEQL